MSKDRKYYSERSFELYEILTDLLDFGSINSEDVLYFPGKHTFSYDDFIETWNFLFSLDKREDKSSTIKDLYWPEERSYFQILDYKFILNSMHGQGSIYHFLLPWDKVPFVEECKIVLNMTELEREFPKWIEREILESERMDKVIQDFLDSEEGQKLIKELKDINKNEKIKNINQYL